MVESGLEVVVVSGLSGAGRSTAAKCLEDLGYYVVDNLPPSLIAAMVDLGSHTSGQVTVEEWEHPYPRRLAAFPAGLHNGPLYADGADKYWPPVSRIDGGYGDRNLVCTCPSPAAFESV